MRQVLLDSDTFSEILAQQNEAVSKRASEYFAEFGNFTISALTLFEVQSGLTSQNKPKVSAALTELMRHLIVLPVRQEEAELAGTIHGLLRQRGTPIGEIDPLLAATSIMFRIPLASGNTRHYQYVSDIGFPLVLENWKA